MEADTSCLISNMALQSKSAVGDVKDAAGDAQGSAKSTGGDINAGAKQVIGEGEGIAKSAGKQADKIANCTPLCLYLERHVNGSPLPIRLQTWQAQVLWFQGNACDKVLFRKWLGRYTCAHDTGKFIS